MPKIDRSKIPFDNNRSYPKEFADVIAGQLDKVPGVLDTTTHIAFRAYSRHDLEAAFSIGFE